MTRWSRDWYPSSSAFLYPAQPVSNPDFLKRHARSQRDSSRMLMFEDEYPWWLLLRKPTCRTIIRESFPCVIQDSAARVTTDFSAKSVQNPQTCILIIFSVLTDNNMEDSVHAPILCIRIASWWYWYRCFHIAYAKYATPSCEPIGRRVSHALQGVFYFFHSPFPHLNSEKDSRSMGVSVLTFEKSW